MKIRHKQSGVVLEGEFVNMGEANALGARSYYVPVGTMSRSEYDMREWEEVKPVWKDVTAECEGIEGSTHVIRNNRLIDANDGYRFRKVGVAIKDETDPYGKYCYGDFHAFIIERRQA